MTCVVCPGMTDLSSDMSGAMQARPGEEVPGTVELRHRYRKAPSARTVSWSSATSQLSRATAPAAVQGFHVSPRDRHKRQRSSLSIASVRTPDMLPMNVDSEQSKKTMLSRQKSRQRDLGYVKKVTAYYSDMTQLGKRLFQEALGKSGSPNGGDGSHLPSLAGTSGRSVVSDAGDHGTQGQRSTHGSNHTSSTTSSNLRKTKAKSRPTPMDRTVALSDMDQLPCYQSAIRKHIEDISHNYEIVVDKTEKRDDYSNCILLPAPGRGQRESRDTCRLQIHGPVHQKDDDMVADASQTIYRSPITYFALQPPRRSWVDDDDLSVASARPPGDNPEPEDLTGEDKPMPDTQAATQETATSLEPPPPPQIVHLADLSVNDTDGAKLPDYICPSSETKSREVAVKIWLGKTHFRKALRTVPLM